jgi:hypothetical protein
MHKFDDVLLCTIAAPRTQILAVIPSLFLIQSEATPPTQTPTLPPTIGTQANQRPGSKSG